MKYFGIIANNFSKACWSWGCVSAIDSNSRTIWIADAHRGDGKRYVVRADEKLTAFIELESAIRANHPSSFALALPQTYTYRSPRPFWISYICFAFVALAFARMYFDAGGGLAMLLAICFPIPFFVAGYFARQIALSILFALLVLVFSILLWLFGFPHLHGLLSIDDLEPNQALERTADRCENLVPMTSTLKPKAQRALVSGRSTSSR